MKCISDLMVAISLLAIATMEALCLNLIDVEILKYEVISTNIFVLIMGVKRYKNLLHPYNVFLFMYTIFLCGKVYFDIFGVYSFGSAGAFSRYSFYEHTQKVMLACLLLGLSSVNFSRVLIRINGDDKDNFVIEYNEKALKYSELGMLLCLPFAIMLLVTKYKMVAQYGYLSLYMYQGGAVSESSYLDHLSLLFHVFYCSFLASGPNIKQFKFFSAIEVLVLGVSLITGVRGLLGVNLLLILSWYTLYIKPIKTSKILALSMGVVILFQVVGVYRAGNDLSAFENDDLNIVLAFARSRSGSINVLGYAEESENKGMVDLFYPLVEYVKGKTDDNYNKEELALGNRLSYEADVNLYFEGSAMGTSYLAELYSGTGFIGVVIGNVLLIYFMLYMLYRYSHSYVGAFGLFMFLRDFYYMPRAPYLNFVIGVGKYIIVILLIRGMYKWKMNTRKENLIK